MTAQTRLRPRHNLQARITPAEELTAEARYRGHVLRTPEDQIVGVKERRNPNAQSGQSAPCRGAEDGGGGEKEAQTGKQQGADAQAVDQLLSLGRSGRNQERCEMQQDQDPANDPVAQAGRRTLAIDRGKQHHEQTEDQNVEHFVFHERRDAAEKDYKKE